VIAGRPARPSPLITWQAKQRTAARPLYANGLGLRMARRLKHGGILRRQWKKLEEDEGAS